MNTLLIIHDNIGKSDENIAYIRREMEACTKKVTATLLVDEEDNDLFQVLESALALSQTLLIVTSKQSFAAVGKMLCTLNRDELLDESEAFPIPNKVEKSDENGYLLAVATCRINVILAEFAQPLPPLLLETPTCGITLNLFGLEADDAKTLLGSIAENAGIKLQAHPHIGGWSVLEALAANGSDMAYFLDNIQIIFANKIIAGESIAIHLVEKLTKLKKKIALAESCTGGRIASLLTAVSGSSAVFDGSMVTYSNEIKSEWIGVSNASLIAYGAVSSAVVEEMAVGMLEKSGADYALAVSGIAGPTGGSPEKPVGTVYVACANRQNGVRSERLNLTGDREYIQIASAYNALRLLIETNYELI